MLTSKRLFCLLKSCDGIKSSVCEKWIEAIVFVSSRSSDLFGSEHSFKNSFKRSHFNWGFNLLFNVHLFQRRENLNIIRTQVVTADSFEMHVSILERLKQLATLWSWWEIQTKSFSHCSLKFTQF